MNINAIFERIGQVHERISSIKPERVRFFENSFYNYVNNFLNTKLKNNKTDSQFSPNLNVNKYFLDSENNRLALNNSQDFKLFGLASKSSLNKEGVFDIIRKASLKYSVPESLIQSVIKVESNYDSRAVSPVGAKGLMQLMPATAKELGVNDVFDPRENVFAGTRYLKSLMNYFDGNLPLSLAAYNSGLKRVVDSGGIPNISETRNYVRKVLSSYNRVNQSK